MVFLLFLLLSLISVPVAGLRSADETHCLCNTSTVWGALRDLYVSTNGAQWIRNTGWLRDGSTVCEWYGVNCTRTADFVFLRLLSNGLDGTLPPSLGDISTMLVFDVSMNPRLRGTLPDSLQQWMSIVLVNASFCAFSGTLPASYRAWNRSITEFDVSNNLLSGTLPESFASWSVVGHFAVSFNSQINGILPVSYASWTTMRRFHVAATSISGTLPPAYRAWTLLQSFNVGNTLLAGTLPSEYSVWINIMYFNAYVCQFTGTLPAAFSAWINVTLFAVYQNELSGTLPPSYSAWSNLLQFVCGLNQLSGTLPPEYGSWTSIQVIAVSYNRLTGPIPATYGTVWPQGAFVSLDNNQLSGTLPRSGWNGLLLGVLTLHNNANLYGAIPVTMTPPLLISLCNTSLCGPLPASWAFVTTRFCQAVDTTFVAHLRDRNFTIVDAVTTAPPACPTPAPPPSSRAPSNQTPLPPPPSTPPVASGLSVEADVGYPVAVAATCILPSVVTTSGGGMVSSSALDAILVIAAVDACSSADANHDTNACQPSPFIAPAVYVAVFLLLVGGSALAFRQRQSAATTTDRAKRSRFDVNARLISILSGLTSSMIPMVFTQGVSLLASLPSSDATNDGVPDGVAAIVGVVALVLAVCVRVWCTRILTDWFPLQWHHGVGDSQRQRQQQRRRQSPSEVADGRGLTMVKAVARWMLAVSVPGRWAARSGSRQPGGARCWWRVGGVGCLEVSRSLVSPLVPTRRWFPLVVWIISTAISCVNGLRVACAVPCRTAIPVLGALVALHAACVVLQPFQLCLKRRWFYVLCALFLVAGVLMLIPARHTCRVASMWLLRAGVAGTTLVSLTADAARWFVGEDTNVGHTTPPPSPRHNSTLSVASATSSSPSRRGSNSNNGNSDSRGTPSRDAAIISADVHAALKQLLELVCEKRPPLSQRGSSTPRPASMDRSTSARPSEHANNSFHGGNSESAWTDAMLNNNESFVSTGCGSSMARTGATSAVTTGALLHGSFSGELSLLTSSTRGARWHPSGNESQRPATTSK